jgi:hypothetical protein
MKSKRQVEYVKESTRLKILFPNILPGIYTNREGIKYQITKIDTKEETAIVVTVRSQITKKRTFHWCRKLMENSIP